MFSVSTQSELLSHPRLSHVFHRNPGSLMYIGGHSATMPSYHHRDRRSAPDKTAGAPESLRSQAAGLEAWQVMAGHAPLPCAPSSPYSPNRYVKHCKFFPYPLLNTARNDTADGLK